MEKQREGEKQGLLWGHSPQGVGVCVSWEGTVGKFGGMEERIRALGPARRGTERFGREWREVKGGGGESKGERRGCGQFWV